MNQILKANPILKPLYEKLNIRIKNELNFQPRLAVIRVGNDPASVIYTERKKNLALKLGFHCDLIEFSAHIEPLKVYEKIHELNLDPTTHAILLQRPLPKAFYENEVIYWINPSKDVDCFHPENVGKLSLGLNGLKSCTPLGIIQLLKSYEIELSGLNVCVMGRSRIVGKPLFELLNQANATVTLAHSHTRRIEKIIAQCELLIVATGIPHLIKPEQVHKDLIVIDVGIHRVNNQITGDVDPLCYPHIKAYSPVPGGVGPMTLFSLMSNVLDASLQFEK